jgi:hypothetical protein
LDLHSEITGFFERGETRARAVGRTSRSSEPLPTPHGDDWRIATDTATIGRPVAPPESAAPMLQRSSAIKVSQTNVQKTSILEVLDVNDSHCPHSSPYGPAGLRSDGDEGTLRQSGLDKDEQQRRQRQAQAS